MALTLSSLLNSPKFLCKYVKIHPPSAVICYAHSQLAVQPRNVERPIIFLCSKEKKKDLKRAPRKDIEDATKQLQIQHLRKEKASLQKIQTYQAVNAMWKRVGTLDIREKLVDESLLKKWNHDPLMDNKQLVLMVFEQDEATGKPSFSCTQNLPRSELGDKDTLPKTPGKKLKVEQIYSHSDRRESSKAGPQFSRRCEPDENLQQVSCTSHTNISLSASILEATMLFADHGYLNDSAKPEKKKSGLKIGPDPTQLSSVLLELRDEIPEFFLKKPNYSIYHQNVRFVNNITGTTTNGIYQYRAQISSFRLMILSCMTELSVDVLKISKHPNEGSVKVRWRIKGIPLIRKFLPYIGRRVREGEDCYRYLDGFSVFEVGSDGLIHCHRLHKVMPSSSHEKENPLWMVFLLPFIRLLDPKSCESFIAFECRSTDEDHVDSLAKSDALTCLSS